MEPMGRFAAGHQYIWSTSSSTRISVFYPVDSAKVGIEKRYGDPKLFKRWITGQLVLNDHKDKKKEEKSNVDTYDSIKSAWSVAFGWFMVAKGRASTGSKKMWRAWMNGRFRGLSNVQMSIVIQGADLAKEFENGTRKLIPIIHSHATGMNCEMY